MIFLLNHGECQIFTPVASLALIHYPKAMVSANNVPVSMLKTCQLFQTSLEIRIWDTQHTYIIMYIYTYTISIGTPVVKQRYKLYKHLQKPYHESSWLKKVSKVIHYYLMYSSIKLTRTVDLINLPTSTSPRFYMTWTCDMITIPKIYACWVQSLTSFHAVKPN